MPKIDSYTIRYVSFPLDAADKPGLGEMLVFVSDDGNEAVEYICPCGCSAKVYVPVNGHGPHCWKLQLQNDVPTLTPSFQMLGRCKSHWFVTNGKVVWC